MRVNPYIEPRGLSGRKVPFYLLTGEYEIRVQLVGRLKTKNGSELKTMLLAPALAPKLDTLDNNNVLKYQMTVPLNRRWVRTSSKRRPFFEQSISLRKIYKEHGKL